MSDNFDVYVAIRDTLQGSRWLAKGEEVCVVPGKKITNCNLQLVSKAKSKVKEAIPKA